MQPMEPLNQAPMPQWISSEQALPPPPKPHKKWRLLAVFVVITLLLVASAIALTFSAPACLTAQDYKTLTGASYDGQMQAANSFYTGVISFKSQSSDYSDPGQVTQLTDFYHSHTQTSIYFTITGTYSYDSQANLAELRATTIQKSLMAAGVPQELISVEPILPSESPDAAEANDTEATTISITSVEGCRQG